MSIIIINSLFVVVIVASALMGIGLLYIAYDISKKEREAEEERLAKMNKQQNFYDVFDKTDLKK